MADAHTKRLTLIACILGSMVVFVDGTVINVALPSIREDLDTGLAAQQQAAVREVKARPLSRGVARHPELDAPVAAASVHAFRWGMAVGGGLMMLGGVISLVGIVNPRRAPVARRHDAAATAAVGETRVSHR
jgi:hypothetical protein